MTELEFIAEWLFGRPTHSRAAGESFWPCPACGGGPEKFHTMPDVPGKKHRFYCFACRIMGDARDLVKLRYPNWFKEFWDGQLARLQADYKNQPAEPEVERLTVFSPRGTRTTATTTADPCLVAIAWDEVPDAERRVLVAAAAVVRRFDGVRVDDLANYAWQIDARLRRWDAEHLAECDDPQCDAVVCAAARQSAPPWPLPWPPAKPKPAARPRPVPKAKPKPPTPNPKAVMKSRPAPTPKPRPAAN